MADTLFDVGIALCLIGIGLFLLGLAVLFWKEVVLS